MGRRANPASTTMRGGCVVTRRGALRGSDESDIMIEETDSEKLPGTGKTMNHELERRTNHPYRAKREQRSAGRIDPILPAIAECER